jgi:hypothetical protein
MVESFRRQGFACLRGGERTEKKEASKSGQQLCRDSGSTSSGGRPGPFKDAYPNLEYVPSQLQSASHTLLETNRSLIDNQRRAAMAAMWPGASPSAWAHTGPGVPAQLQEGERARVTPGRIDPAIERARDSLAAALLSLFFFFFPSFLFISTKQIVPIFINSYNQ